ncbi:asparagine synthase (glutamine-hydrolyzing) [Rhodomicrobium vannielii ATCC 17100]|uniref:asparagine synthase (glutamine-hydrolyzing) n=1 Tax=Rhodomicrobium vannielii (strain ATCC 17100 / DSM 162 / LMG 4299 / NCIMB 10020 / ATH 3.1.1) TaxID=648757 RepID=E3I0Y8_RHOVT|nr:asparagine synthase (glutamine-hydrolyzing) [Rhodomicrobium vannielii]ADP72311.1 asparagine synthase (glutamine-hydrolyzing) [Rhodomicrobium vannielii ATCC 17100]
MCGINGAYSYRPAALEVDRGELLATRDQMTARGPDGAGVWLSDCGRLGLGHRRLAIIDLSEAGAQPMHSADGRFTVTFNGEIYNYLDLRRSLEARGQVFRSHSDTEILLHLYAEKGAEMVHDLRGMFAFAIWDAHARTLFLARDTYGIKPLYYADDGGAFRFASQVKALLAGGAVAREPDPAGIVGFHLWGAVPEPFTLYRDVKAVPAGHSILVREGSGAEAPVAYANIAAVLCEAARAATGRQEIGRVVRNAVRDSVRAHLLADVDVGIFLSAGIDSGAMLGLMRDVGHERRIAVTVAFREFRATAEDEAPLAAEIARLYGARHIVRIFEKSEFEADLPLILDAMDQPSIDGVNTWFAAKAAREAGLKVALSGLGGDELFGGYPSFRQIPRWVSFLKAANVVPGAGRAARVLASRLAPAALSPKALALLEYAGTFPGAYLVRRSVFLPFQLDTVLDPGLLRDGLARLQTLKSLRATMTPDPKTAVSRVAALESANYMRNQLLRDADWAGMAHGLEIRTPLADFELLKALAPYQHRFRGAAGKQALAEAPSVPLPDAVVNRSKSGFGVPIGAWLARAAQMKAPARKGDVSRAWALHVYQASG